MRDGPCLGRSCSIKCKKSRPWPGLWTPRASSGHLFTLSGQYHYAFSHLHQNKYVQCTLYNSKSKEFRCMLQFLFINACVFQALYCDTQSWILPRPPKMKLFLSVSSQHAAVCSQAAVIISLTTPHRYQAHCTRNWPIRGLGHIPVTNERTACGSPWSWLITLRKLIISKVKFLSPPLFVLRAMNTNFINLLNIRNFTSHHPPPSSASEKSRVAKRLNN